MYVRALDLIGFKSFATRQRLEFTEGITAVVGPNGSGKSNIFDAIKWVVGEQSARQLRGGKMSDVLFHGTNSKPQSSVCEVTVELDNQDKTAPAPYTQETTIAITRKLYRSGDSEYRINGTRVRLRDIQEFWMDAAVGAYTFMEQGRVSELVQAKPKEVRGYIEEAAQIIKFQKRIAESKRKFVSAESHLQIIDATLEEEQRMLAYLKRQANKVRRYKELSDQKKSIDSIWLYRKYEKVLESVARAKEQKIEAAASLDKSRSNVQVCEANLASVDGKTSSLRGQIEAHRLSQKEKSAALSKLHEEHNEIAKQEAVLQAERGRAANRLKEIDQELLAMQQSSEASQADALRAKLTEHNQLLQTAETKVEAVSIRLQEAKERMSVLAAQVEQSEAARSVWQNAVHKSEARKAELHSRISEIETRSQELEPLVEELQNKLDQARQSVLEATSAESEISERIVDCENRLQLARESHEKAQSEFASWEAMVRSLTAEKDRLLQTLERQEKEGLNSELHEHIQGLKSQGQFLGTVAEIVSDLGASPEQLERAYGSILQAYVVKEDALVGVRALLEEHPCPAVFVACASAHDLRGAVQREIESETSVVLENGLRSFQFVGFSAVAWHKDSGTVLLRQQLTQTEKELKKQVALGDALSTAKSKALNDLEAIKAELSEARAQRADRQSKAKEAAHALQTVEREYSSTIARSEAAELNLEQLRRSLDSVAHELQELQQNPPSDAADSGARTQAEEQYEAIQKEMSACVDERNQRKSSAQNVEQELQSIERRMREHQVRHEMLDAEMRSLGHIQSESQEKLSTVAAQKQDVDGRIRGQKETVQTSFARLDTLEQNLAQLLDERKEIEIVFRAAVEQNTSSESNHRHSLERISELERQLEEVNQESIESIGSSPATWDPNELQLDLDLEELQKKRSALHEQITKLGGVDLEAEHEYSTKEEEYKSKLAQKDDLIETIRMLRATIASLEKEAAQRFEETYSQIDRHFREVFPKLFPGGKAELLLQEENEENPVPGVQIMAYPPGKRFARMELLSGGEKSLTATALILSIFLCNPSPFCLLDELDAPLDDVNLDLLGNVLQEMNSASQVILVTHNKSTMQIADRVYGVTTDEPGVSKVYSIQK